MENTEAGRAFWSGAAEQPENPYAREDLAAAWGKGFLDAGDEVVREAIAQRAHGGKP